MYSCIRMYVNHIKEIRSRTILQYILPSPYICNCVLTDRLYLEALIHHELPHYGANHELQKHATYFLEKIVC